jgi:hypothetical protein
LTAAPRRAPSVTVLTDAFAGLQKLVLPDRWQADAIRALEAQYGLDNLYNLKGGILAYQEQAQEV